MDPRVALCEHLASDALAALPVESDDVIEWHDEPVAAVVRCPRCHGAGLLELLDVCDGGRPRIYALSGVATDAVALWRRNLARGSCDLARRERETEALVASAGPPARLVARDAATSAVVRTVAWPRDATFPGDTWWERLARAPDPARLAALGLGRGAAP